VKALTFNQLQVRIFFLIFILFTSAVLSYRVFIERPQLEQSVLQIAKKELKILNHTAKRYLNSLNSINYDYAVWDQSYDYMQDHQSKDEKNRYINENYVDDTFVSLAIDGVFIFDKNLAPIFVKGYHHNKNIPLTFSFYDFSLNPINKNMFPSHHQNKKVAQNSGLINTQYGPALFNITEIRRSDKTGENSGFILFIKLLSADIIEEIEQYTMTKITTEPITHKNNTLPIGNWTDEVTLSSIRKYSKLYINDFNQKPLLLIKIKHSKGEIPPLLDKQSFIFIGIFTVLIFIVYSLISFIIIRPVRVLADQIKSIDEDTMKLDEHYQIDELDSVSQHFNSLMATISHQKALLSQQAFTDTLTNISNRRGFELHLEKQWQLFIRNKIGFAILMADIDHFKLFNDSLGHIAGDEALIKVSQVLNKHFKRSNDLCARYGGEEFIMLYSSISFIDLKKLLEKILDAFSHLNLHHPASPTSKHVTISIGACIIEPSIVVTKELPQKALILAADSALYRAKKAGRNRYEINKLIDFIDNQKI